MNFKKILLTGVILGSATLSLAASALTITNHNATNYVSVRTTVLPICSGGIDPIKPNEVNHPVTKGTIQALCGLRTSGACSATVFSNTSSDCNSGAIGTASLDLASGKASGGNSRIVISADGTHVDVY